MRDRDLRAAQQFAEQGDLDAAYKIADRYLTADPNDGRFLMVMIYVMMASKKMPIAYSLAKRAVELMPRNAGAWMNMGMAANDLWLTKEAERAYKKALKFANNDGTRSKIHVNLAAMLIDTGDFEGSEAHSLQALEYNPESSKSVANLGFCQLAQRNWQDGWPNYRHCLGTDWRPRQIYNDEPEWDGESKGTIVAYAEQGLGDVISFASIMPDLLTWADDNDSRVILEVDDRLEGLFRRSFPKATVYGTRGQEGLRWAENDQKVDYSLPMGQFAEYFRHSDEDFPGTPYLTPDPDRVLQWKALFKAKKKPVIGIGWRGGIPRTGAKFRQWDLEQLLPILRSVDAHWVSLQYKPAGKEIAAFKAKYPDIDIAEYPHGTLTRDYDDTVALTAALDHVVCMQTAITHVCGAVGVPCWVFVPKNSQWRYGNEGEDFVWAKSVRIIRQSQRGQWSDEIERTAGELSALYPGISKATGKAARKGKLRRNGKKVRPANQSDRGQDGNNPSPGLRVREQQKLNGNAAA